MTDYKYATFMETNCDEHESWYVFIRWQGNEEALKHLYDQLESVEWHCEDEDDFTSAFDLDIEHLVSEQTARECCTLELNSMTFHRKFDGKMSRIDMELESTKPSKSMTKKEMKKFKIKKNDKNIRKANRLLGYGKIEEFLEDEDVNEENQVDEDEDDVSDTDSDSSSSDDEYKLSREDVPKNLL